MSVFSLDATSRFLPMVRLATSNSEKRQNATMRRWTGPAARRRLLSRHAHGPWRTRRAAPTSWPSTPAPRPNRTRTSLATNYFFSFPLAALLRCSVAPLLLFPPGPINLSGRGSYLAVPCSLTRTALPCSVSAKDTPRPGARPGRLRQRGLWIGCYHSEKKIENAGIANVCRLKLGMCVCACVCERTFVTFPQKRVGIPDLLSTMISANLTNKSWFS